MSRAASTWTEGGGARQSMKALWILIVMAGTGGAQWRHFAEPASLAREILSAHNAVRAKEGVAPLAWSVRLAALSQECADTLLARRKFAHRPNSDCGENLFEIIGASASPEQVVVSCVGRGVPEL